MQLGPREISKLLSDQSEHVCHYLLPGGKKVGNNWVAGSIHGGEGKSLQIALGGSKAGIGADFADPESFKGDLLTLWAKVRNVSLRDAIVEAKSWLGVEQAQFTPKVYRKPTRPADVTHITKRVGDYLHEKRKISKETIRDLKIRATEDDEIVFPSLSLTGELLACKFLKVERINGKKQIRAEAGCAPTFYGWQAIAKRFADCSEVIITEGEIDCATWIDAGFPALSLPNGASSAKVAIEYDWDNLAQFDVIYLCPDNDPAGQEMVKIFADKIGKSRIRLIKLPFKDANEAKLQGWTKDDFNTAVMTAKGLLDDKILTYASAADDIWQWRSSDGVSGRIGTEIPLLGPKIRIVRGHVMVLSGEPSHGKSLVINQVAIEIVDTIKEPVAIVSLEVPTLEAMAQIVDLTCETQQYSKEQFEKFVAGAGHSYVFLRETGRVSVSTVLEFCEYARSRYGCTHFIVDNLTKLATRADDWAQQGDDINRISDFARNNNVVMWLLAHPRKAREGKREVGMEDIRGTSILVDCASTILHVVRNKKKEKSSDPDKNDPDTTIYCSKQKVTGIEPVIKLFKVEADVIKLARKEQVIRDEDVGKKREEKSIRSERTLSDYAASADP